MYNERYLLLSQPLGGRIKDHRRTAERIIRFSILFIPACKLDHCFNRSCKEWGSNMREEIGPVVAAYCRSRRCRSVPAAYAGCRVIAPLPSPLFLFPVLALSSYTLHVYTPQRLPGITLSNEKAVTKR